MENEESLILDFVLKNREELFGRKRDRHATKKRQRKWQQLHKILINHGQISRRKEWISTRTTWYRMVSNAKANLRKYTAGHIENLHQQDRKVLDVLGIPIVEPILVANEQIENLQIVEEGSEMRLECLEYLADGNEFSVTPVSEMNDLELRKALLRQEFRLNEYKLLKMKYFFMRFKEKSFYQQFLKEIEA